MSRDCVCARCYNDPLRLYCTLTFLCECGAEQKITYATNGGDIVGHEDGYQCTECRCYYKHAYKIDDEQELVKHLFYIDHPPCPSVHQHETWEERNNRKHLGYCSCGLDLSPGSGWTE